MATTTKRVLISQTIKRVSSLSFNGWELTITDEAQQDQQVKTVSITGNKAPSSFLNMNINELGTNVSFNKSEYDYDLIDAIKLEVADIMKPAI